MLADSSVGEQALEPQNSNQSSQSLATNQALDTEDGVEPAPLPATHLIRHIFRSQLRELCELPGHHTSPRRESRSATMGAEEAASSMVSLDELVCTNSSNDEYDI